MCVGGEQGGGLVSHTHECIDIKPVGRGPADFMNQGLGVRGADCDPLRH